MKISVFWILFISIIFCFVILSKPFFNFLKQSHDLPYLYLSISTAGIDPITDTECEAAEDANEIAKDLHFPLPYPAIDYAIRAHIKKKGERK